VRIPLNQPGIRGRASNLDLVSVAVVTVGAGFLGSHLCDYLLERGHSVIRLDNLDTGSLQNVEHIRDPKFMFVNQVLGWEPKIPLEEGLRRLLPSEEREAEAVHV
jgi:nucleoside-diphosphate-sugar epimerase